MPKKSVTIKRFEAGADADEKREFAKRLVAALEEIEVPPGWEFAVTTTENLEELDREIRDKEEELVKHDAAVKDAEEAILGIQGIVDDYRLGILDRQEMLERVRRYESQYV